MSTFKGAAGVVVLVVGTVGFALIFAGLGLGYSTQHVHSVTASIDAGQAVKHIHDYDHSLGGIVAVCGVLAFAWAILSMFVILLGGVMIANRSKSWDC